MTLVSHTKGRSKDLKVFDFGYAGRSCLHYAAGYGHEECVERLLEKQFDPVVQDHNGDTALHLAAIHGCPMSAFNLTKAAPATCLTKNQKQQRPADVAKACERGEVASLALACTKAFEVARYSNPSSVPAGCRCSTPCFWHAQAMPPLLPWMLCSIC